MKQRPKPRSKPRSRSRAKAKPRSEPAKLSIDDPRKVQRKLIDNILAKIERGGSPTVAELKTLRDFEQTGGIPEASGAEWVSSYEQLGEVLGCHRASFPRWRRSYSDCPKARQDGCHSVAAWRTFFAAHPEIRGAGDITLEMQRLELEDMRQTVRGAIFANDEREGFYTKNAIAVPEITKAVTEAKRLLRQKLEFELPTMTANKSLEEVRARNRAALDEICPTLGALAAAWKV